MVQEVFRWTNLQHTVPQTPWINKSGIFPNRLNMDQLKFDNRRELVSLLEDVVSQKIENTENQILSTDMLDSNEEISVHQEFPIKLGWALKENQKFGKKGSSKRINKHIVALLEGYFLAGNLNKSDRYSAQEMWNELTKLIEELFKIG
uniref:Uncharacterized protein n=1 Tax=Rhizophagus irregularis (strain DAOM 181602 / DAOM 197198 / MUCL 43194) TaxID=747089 RepID=U9SYC3_RHIID